MRYKTYRDCSEGKASLYEAANGHVSQNLKDPELKALALQLSDHMESIKTNLQQVDGIVPQLARGRAALQDVLFRYLSQEQYERVVLG